MSARLPNPGSDDGVWGELLNAFLEVAHNADGSLQTAAVPLSGGDLSGTLAVPTVSKLNGVTLGGTPASGKVLMASSSTAASWQLPGGVVSRQVSVWANGLASVQVATVGVWTPSYFRATDTGGQYVGWLNISDGTQNDSITFDFVAGAGTYSLELYHLPYTNRGIYTIKVDGTTVGTIDGYAALLALASQQPVSIRSPCLWRLRMPPRLGIPESSSDSF
jgi:hypothetical protein